MKKKIDFDTVVAADFGLRRKEVSAITAAFLQEVKNTIMEDNLAYLDGFGRFKVHADIGSKRLLLPRGTLKKGERKGTIIVEVPLKLRVHFSKAPSFKKQFHEFYKARLENGEARRR